MKTSIVRKMAVVAVASSLLFVLAGCPDPTLWTPGTTSHWLVMVYMAADNDLSDYGTSHTDYSLRDIDRMESAYKDIYTDNQEYAKQVNIVVMLDRKGHDTELYQILPADDNDKIDSKLLKSYGPLNSGDDSTLTTFVAYCTANYTYEHSMLIIYDHGGGSRVAASRDVCIDDTSNDRMWLGEVKDALTPVFSTAKKIDVIGFSACLMGMTEVAYEFKDFADYFVGSMNEANPWDLYGLFYKGSTVSPLDPINTSPEEFAIRAVAIDRDYQSYHYPGNGHTLSAIDLSKMNALKTSIDQFATALYQAGKETSIETLRDTALHYQFTVDDAAGWSIHRPHFDLYDLANKLMTCTPEISPDVTAKAQGVIDALSAAVIMAFANYGTIDGIYQPAYYGPGSTVHRGLAIFMSRGEKTYSGYAQYRYQWWYTTVDTVAWATAQGYSSPADYLYGKIDFCTSNSNGVVETWRELFEAWYDPGNLYTPESF